MKLDPIADLRQSRTTLGAQGWPQLSDRARDAGDRAICGASGGGGRMVLRHTFIPMTTLPSHDNHLGDLT
jgi:hypothetical protein